MQRIQHESEPSCCSSCNLSCFEVFPLSGAAFFLAISAKEFIFGSSVNAGINGLAALFCLGTFGYIKQHKSIEKMTLAFERSMDDLNEHITQFSSSCAQLTNSTSNLTPLLTQINNNLDGLRSDYQKILLLLQNGAGNRATQTLMDQLRQELVRLNAEITAAEHRGAIELAPRNPEEI